MQHTRSAGAKDGGHRPGRVGRGVLGLVLVLLLPSAAHAQAPAGAADTGPVLHSQFVRAYQESGRVDTLRGAFYYLGPNHVYFDIVAPLRQIMVIQDREMTIYYPEHNRGFIIEAKNPVTLPMVPGIMAAVRQDYGLTALGYEIDDQAVQGDTLVTTWRHPQGGDLLGAFRLGRVDDRLTYAIYSPSEVGAEVKTVFEDYRSVGTLQVPTFIRTDNRSLRGTAWERLRLISPTINPPVPDAVLHFQIPSDARVERRTM